MSYSPGIGLVLGLGLDSSGVEPGLQDFDKLLDDATQQWNAKWEESTRDVDEHLLSNRESVRLFGEEFGIHVPRAVSSALAKILPDIASLGGALLGIYAAKELYDGVGKFTDWVRASFTEQTADAQEFAKAAASAYEAAGKAAEGAFTKFKTVEAGAFNIAEIDARTKHLETIALAYRKLVHDFGNDIQGFAAADAEGIKVIAQAMKEGIDTPKKAEEEFAKAGALQFAARQRMAEVQKKTDEETAKEREKQAAEAARLAAQQASAEYRAAEAKYQANQKAFQAAEERLRREFEMQNRVGREAVEAARKGEEADKKWAEAKQKLTEKLDEQTKKQAHLAEELGKEINRQIADINRVGNEQERQAERGKNEAIERINDQHREALEAIQNAQQQADAIARLKGDYTAMAQAGIAAYNAMAAANGNYLKQLVAQHKEEQKAATEAMNAELAGIGALAEGAAQLAGSKKAYYAVKAGEEVAAALEALAEGTWPPNPMALIASGIHFESAAEYAKLAGTSAGRRGAGATGAGSEYGAPSGGGEYRSSGRVGAGDQFVSGGGLAPGAQGSTGGRLNVIVIGESEQARFFADRVNAADAAGHFMTVSTARRSAPAQG
jgi:hypothetical protein